MRKNKFHFLIFAIVILLFATLFTFAFSYFETGKFQDEIFKIKSDKDSIFLGESLQLEFEFNNKGEKTIQIPTGGVMSGNTLIFISKKSEKYRRYVTSGWGRDAEKIVTLNPNQSYKIIDKKATVLWNGKPNYSHLNSDAAKEADKFENRILTDYAFPEEGIYFIKAVSCLIDGIKGCSIPIESEPIQITVKEPIGEDLEVWKIMKENPKIGLFLQTNGDSLRDEDKNIIDEVRRLTETYPNSRYAQALNQSLAKFRADELKRQEFYQRTEKNEQKPK